MRKSSLQISKQLIENYFKKNKVNVYNVNELFNVLLMERKKWEIAKSINLGKFIKYLTEENILGKIELNFPNKREIRYIYGRESIYKILLSLNLHGYLSHFTAAYLNELIKKEPKEIYLNIEQTPKPRGKGILVQENIDRAFSNKPRITNNFFEYLDYKIYRLNGKNSDNLGLIKRDLIRLTNIERTLIDITVRPQYAGGVKCILAVYKNAIEKVSVKKLIGYLKKLDYIYPYHQAIGFYLEKAGLKDDSINILRKMKMNYYFYLTNQMNHPKYSKEWRLYYPNNLAK